MSPNEFKDLNNKFLTKLKFELDKRKADFKILQSDPFTQGVMLGVFYKDSPNFLEVYSLQNSGDVAEYHFKGHTQMQQGE